MRAEYIEVLRDLVFRSIQQQTRLSEAQVARLRWSQIHGDTIRTTRQRDCKVSGEVIAALSLLPHRQSGVDYVFFGNSLSVDQIRIEKERKKSDQQPKRRFVIFKRNRIA